MSTASIFQQTGFVCVGHNFARLVRASEPSVEPVTSAEAKLWLKLDDTADDAIVVELIKAARSIFEELTGRTLISTGYVAYFDSLPRVGTYIGAATSRELVLPRAPLIEVTAINYLNTDGAEQEFADTEWDPDEASLSPSRFPRLFLAADSEWPTLGNFPGALRVAFSAGYGTTAADVSAEIKVCLKMMVTAIYQDDRKASAAAWMGHPLIQMHAIPGLS